jgi:hypothetical protein
MTHRQFRRMTCPWLQESGLAATTVIRIQNGHTEWPYRDIAPCLLFEEWLNVDGKSPDDCRVYSFDREQAAISPHRARGVNHPHNFYNTSWNGLPLKVMHDKFNDTLYDTLYQSGNLSQMLEAGALLSVGIDCIRGDAYNIVGRIVFGESTNYLGAGLFRFEPAA